ncbi:hypothetical protein FRC10_005752 [Ceratobasidium sp. 414]|nr:hypothetical protein FRC10_005752 [Ceratobasidium sp. 414]
MLFSLLLVALALLSVTGVGAVLSSVRFLFHNPPFFAFVLLALCILAPSHDGHACEQLDKSGRLLPCYPHPGSKRTGQMCRSVERRHALRQLWRQVERPLGKLLNPVLVGVQEIWARVSGLYKYLRDGTPIFLSAALSIARAASTSTEVQRGVLVVCLACLADYLVRYVFVPEVTVLLVFVGAGWTFRKPLREYLMSTGPVLSYLDCYNKLKAQPKRATRKGNKTECLALMKHQKVRVHEPAAARHSQPTKFSDERTTISGKACASPVSQPDPTSTSQARGSGRRAFAPSATPIQFATSEKRKKSMRTPKAKAAAPAEATGTHESRRKITIQKPKDEPIGKPATSATIPNSELAHQKVTTRVLVSSYSAGELVAAIKERGVVPTTKITPDSPRAKSTTPSQTPSISTIPASIIIDCRSEAEAAGEHMDEEKSRDCMAPGIAPEVEASGLKARPEHATEDDTKQASKNVVPEEGGVSTAETTIAPVPQTNSVDVLRMPIPAIPSVLPVSEDPSQAGSTSSCTDRVASTEQLVHISDENQSPPRSLSAQVISEAIEAPTPVDAQVIAGTPAECSHYINTLVNPSQPEASVTTAPSGNSPKQASPKRKKILKSPSRSTSSRVSRLYAPIPRSQAKNTILATRLKEKRRMLRKAKLGRRSKRLVAAAVLPSVGSTESSVVALVQPLPAAVPEMSMPAPLPMELEPAGNTAVSMEVCQQPAATPSETAAIEPVMDASPSPMDELMPPAESSPAVYLPAVEPPLTAIAQPIPPAPVTIASRAVAPPSELAPLPAIVPRTLLSIPCKPVNPVSFFKPYKPAQVPRSVYSSIVGLSGAAACEDAPQATTTAPLPVPTTRGLSHIRQYTPVPVPRPVASPFVGPSWAGAGHVPAPKPVPTKPAPTLKTGPTIIHNPAEDKLIAAFKQSSGPKKPSKLTETDFDYKLVVAPSTCRQLGRVETKKNAGPRKNVVYSVDAQGKNRVTAGEVGREVYVYKWNLDLGTPGVKMRAPEELWKAL